MADGGPLSDLRLDEAMKLTASELEFIAEDELVDIVPRFKFDHPVNMMCGTFGPFDTMVPTKVPLWFAIQLVQRNLAKVQPPSWLQEEEIKDLLDREVATKSRQLLQEVPFHYKEIATLILRHCPEAFAGREGRVQVMLKDIEELREAKLHTSLGELKEDHPAINISNIGAMEMNKMRPFLINALHQFRDLKRGDEAVRQGSQAHQPQPAGGL
uniref:DNA replication complex GINS protein PSF2 n=1 Tax=Hemiselmis tepida TaxID=464990 RepID=A0A7S0YLU5_9CRYP